MHTLPSFNIPEFYVWISWGCAYNPWLKQNQRINSISINPEIVLRHIPVFNFHIFIVLSELQENKLEKSSERRKPLSRMILTFNAFYTSLKYLPRSCRPRYHHLDHCPQLFLSHLSGWRLLWMIILCLLDMFNIFVINKVKESKSLLF